MNEKYGIWMTTLKPHDFSRRGISGTLQKESDNQGNESRILGATLAYVLETDREEKTAKYMV